MALNTIDLLSRSFRLTEPHVAPLTMLVEGMRARGLRVPDVDPNDGGTRARALFLMETPGPKAVTSGFVSRDNPDQSAGNMAKSLIDARFAREDVVLWNVLPWCISTEEKSRNPTTAELWEARSDTEEFIAALPKLRVIVFCGRKAQRARKFIRVPPTVGVIETFHTGAQAYNRPHQRDDITRRFQEAAALAFGS
jgi:uracil-DNA glycosylase